jgi:hypothetical protein
MTMINFKRTGGIMGRETEVDIDLNRLPASESQRVHQLVTESKFFEIPLFNSPVSTSPDEFEYTITIVAGNSIHTVRASDTAMPRSLRPLIDELTEIAKEAQNT